MTAATTPRVAIGIPAYKAGRWIAGCLDSLQAQTMVDFEILVSDNASPDQTYEICQAYAARDPRIRVIRQSMNIGVSGNHNAVYAGTTAPFFCWASANDYYEPDFLARCLETLEAQPDVVLVAARASTFHEKPGDGVLLVERILPDIHDESRRFHAVIRSMRDSRMFRGVYRRAAADRLPPLVPMFGHDHFQVVAMATLGRLVQLNEPLYFERDTSGARTTALPIHQRTRHYEPIAGIAAIVFHRSRLIAMYWRLALGRAKGLPQQIRAVIGMMRLTLGQPRMLAKDVLEVLGLIQSWVLHRR